MPKLTRRTERYAHGTIRVSADGSRFFASVYLAGGERRRAMFRDRMSAHLWLDSQSAEYRPLSAAQMLDASRAYSMLPEGVTLLDCAKSYLAANTVQSPLSFGDAADAFLVARRVSLRPSTAKWYENILSSFARDLAEPDRSLSEIQPAEVERILEARTPSIRNAMLRVLAAFFSWAIKSGHAASDPSANLERARMAKPKRAVLSVRQACSLLVMCEYTQPAAVPYLAIGLFAGIRPQETRRLRAEDFRNGYVYVGPHAAKTAAERTVPIRPNLAAWLEKYPVGERGVYPGSDISLTRLLRRLFYAIGAEADRKDILRHSFASYAYDLTGDAARVAAELGHADTSMLFRHYRGLVPPGSGADYFAISPTVAQTLPKTRTQTASKRT